jgi:glycosyltransferase involved in cell wall biosynthesis
MSSDKTLDNPAATTGTLLVSIIVSTYRRSDMLHDALKSLRQLAVRDGLAYEVLVVDNDSACSAHAVVESVRPEWHDSAALRYISETRPGLVCVRNRGIDESRGDIISFLDDDIFIDENWLLEIVDCFARTGADCVGARTVIRWEGEPEASVLACENELVQSNRGGGEFEFRGAAVPGGGNMAVRRELVAEGFRFVEELGRIGTVLLSGEDTEAIRRIRAAGKRIWYCGRAVMHHRTGGQRLKASYYVRRAYWFGISYALVDRKLCGKWYQIVAGLARLAKVMLVAIPSWLLAKIRRDPAANLLLRAFLARQAGYLHATFRPHKLIPEAMRSKG